jgi:uncharacterized protein
MLLTPKYDLSVGGTSILSRLDGRGVSITLTDQAGTESDTLEIEVEAGDQAVQLPRKGAVIEVSLGYEQTGLRFMGSFEADEVEVSGPPTLIRISCKSASMRKTLKEQRSRSFERKTIGQIVAQIAGEHGLVAAVSPEFASRRVAYLAQTEESDPHLLTRIARLNGAVAAFKKDRIVFVKRGAGLSASGVSLAPVTLYPEFMTSWTIRMPDRPQVKTTKAHWHDRQTATRKFQEVDAGGDVAAFQLRHGFATEEEAQHAAASKADDLQRASGSFSGELPGDPTLMAETPVTTIGFYPGTATTWIVKTATHTMDGDGFTTSIDCEVKA